MGRRGTDLKTLDREAECVKLRRQGLTLEEIAKIVGYANPAVVSNALKRAYARITAEDVADMRQMECQRLDLLQNANWAAAMKGDIPAGNLVLKIIDRRAKLFGLDMPIRIQQEVTVWNGDGNLDAEIQRLIDQIADASSGGSGVLAEGAGAGGATAPAG